MGRRDADLAQARRQGPAARDLAQGRDLLGPPDACFAGDESEALRGKLDVLHGVLSAIGHTLHPPAEAPLAELSEQAPVHTSPTAKGGRATSPKPRVSRAGARA